MNPGCRGMWQPFLCTQICLLILFYIKVVYLPSFEKRVLMQLCFIAVNNC